MVTQSGFKRHAQRERSLDKAFFTNIIIDTYFIIKEEIHPAYFWLLSRVVPTKSGLDNKQVFNQDNAYPISFRLQHRSVNQSTNQNNYVLPIQQRTQAGSIQPRTLQKLQGTVTDHFLFV